VELGIDFGTTRTVVACADRGNHPVVGFTDPAGDAAQWIPSVVAERGGDLLFGFDAVAAANDPSCTVTRSFKRLLGGADAGPGQEITVGSRTVGAGELTTGFLAYVRRALLERSDLRRSSPVRPRCTRPSPSPPTPTARSAW
jgi:molecular chaperone DnaK (HSP70)